MKWKNFSLKSLLAIAAFSAVFFYGCTKADDLKTSIAGEEVTATTPQQWEVDDIKNQMQWKWDSYEGREDEIKRFNRGTDASKVNALMVQWKAELDKLQAIVDAGDVTTFWDTTQIPDDINSQINDAFTEIYSRQNFDSAVQQATKDKPKQLKDIERQLKDLEKTIKSSDQTTDVSALKGYIEEMKQHIATMGDLAAQSTSGLDGAGLDDLATEIWDAIGGFDDAANDFYNDINDINEGVWDQQRVSDAKKNLRDKERSIKDLNKEVKRLSKNVDSSNPSLAEATRVIGEMEKVVEQIKAAIESNDSETLQYIDSDFWDYQSEAWEYINELNEVQNSVQQSKDTARSLKDKKQWHKDKERECKRVKCEETEAGPIIQQMRDILAQMGQAVNEARYDDFWDLDRDYNDLDPEFWEFVGQKQSEKDIRRWLKDVSREWKDKGRWIADLEREAKHGSGVVDADGVARLQELHDQAIGEVKQAEEFYSQGVYDEARYLLEDLNEKRMEFDEITGGFNEGREKEYFVFEIEQLREEIENGKAVLEEKLENDEIDQERADLCGSYIEQGLDYIDELQKIQEENRIGEIEEVQLRLQDLGNQADRDCGDIFEETGDSYQTFNEFWVPEDLQGIADEIFARLSTDLEERLMSGVLDKLTAVTSQFNEVLERFGQRFEEVIAEKLQAISFIAEEYQEELLSRTAAIFEKVEQVEGRTDGLTQAQRDKFERIKNDLLSYNFYGNTAGDVEDYLDGLTSENLNEGTLAEFERKLAETKKAAVVEKYDLGIIPFRDTDDHEWYTVYVVAVADRGIVQGKSDQQGNLTGYYDPGANVTVGEMLKMSLEAAGMGQDGGEPSLVSARNHWARGYVRRAEILGLDIVSDLDSLDRPATRAEIVKTALQARGIAPMAASSSPYADVSLNHPAIDYIVEATNLQIVKGDSTGNTFRPEDGVNRAETAKIINNVAEAPIYQ